LKKKVVHPDSLAFIPPDVMPEVLAWAVDCHTLTETEQGN